MNNMPLQPQQPSKMPAAARCPSAWASRLVLFAAAGCIAWQASGAAPQVLPPGERPADVRLEPLKDLNGYFPFEPPNALEAWAVRARELESQLRVSLGLWPMPTRTPLRAVVHGRVDPGDYTIEKVYFESLPGFFVTGNLYRPKGRSGRMPGILCPHGHWDQGRFYDSGRQAVRQLIVQGAERFEDGGRSPMQAR